MKLGGSARVRVSNAQGCFLSHMISSCSGGGKHGGMRLLVFDIRRGSRRISPTPYNAPAGQKTNRIEMRISQDLVALNHGGEKEFVH